MIMRRRALNFLLTRQRCSMHTMPTYPFRVEEGVSPFLSSNALELMQGIHRRHLQRVNQLTQGTTMSPLTLYQVVERTHNDSSQALLYHHASQAWNIDFFMQGLSCRTREMLPALKEAIERDFGSINKMREEFDAAAMGMVASGWVWLLRMGNGKMSIINTCNGDSPMFVRMRTPLLNKSNNNANSNNGGGSGEKRNLAVNRPLAGILGMKTENVSSKGEEGHGIVPVLGLNMWEHAWIPDYGGEDKGMYVENFWNNVNWNRAALVLSIY